MGLLLAVLLVGCVSAGGPSTNSRRYGSGHLGSVHRPVGGGHLGHVGGHFGTHGVRPGRPHGHIGGGHVGGIVGGGHIGGQVGVVGGFPQGVSPPLISAVHRPDCKFFKRGPHGKYICDVDQKPYECPVVRPYCPKFAYPTAPQQCYNDNDCYGNDKCCRDACFN